MSSRFIFGTLVKRLVLCPGVSPRATATLVLSSAICPVGDGKF